MPFVRVELFLAFDLVADFLLFLQGKRTSRRSICGWRRAWMPWLVRARLNASSLFAHPAALSFTSPCAVRHHHAQRDQEVIAHSIGCRLRAHHFLLLCSMAGVVKAMDEAMRSMNLEKARTTSSFPNPFAHFQIPWLITMPSPGLQADGHV